MIAELTKEQQIAKHYSSAMDSVNLINALKAKSVLTPEEVDRMKANKDHLKIMLAKNYWTIEDLAPLKTAAGE